MAIPHLSFKSSGFGTEIARYRGGVIVIALLSGIMNVLALGGSLFMMLVYDMVLPSRSASTLIGLSVVISLIFVFQGGVEMVRSRLLMQIGGAFAASLNSRVYDCLTRLPLVSRGSGDATQPLRDLDAVRAFLSGTGPAALIDLPWLLFFIGILLLLHPLLGLTAAAGGTVLLALTFATDRVTRTRAANVGAATARRQSAAEDGYHHAEVIAALGMRGRTAERWRSISSEHLSGSLELATVTGSFATTSKMVRVSLQSLVLAVGAALVINDKASGGVIFASSVLTARALAPVELAIANWRGLVMARQSWARLTRLFEQMPSAIAYTALPPPASRLTCERVSLVPPGSNQTAVNDVSFTMEAGQAVAVVGPSASGKSTLSRGLVGVWRPARGHVRLDNASLDQWDSDALGRHIGYLPQAVQLMPGSVTQNIARFDPNAPDDAIISAAKAAGVHDMIVRLPMGYDTQIGNDGAALSAGERQRIGLARALFGDPFLVVLDEPNSNLDQQGEAALAAAVAAVRARGGIVVVIAHRTAILDVVDLVLVMNEGRVQAFGPRDAVLQKLRGPSVVTRIDQAQKAGRARGLVERKA